MKVFLILFALAFLVHKCTTREEPRLDFSTYSSPLNDADANFRDLCAQEMRGQLPGYLPGMAFPSVSNHGSGNEFYFAWPTGSLPGGSSGSCIGTRNPLAVTQITINGQTVK